jgi:hypothetical protein
VILILNKYPVPSHNSIIKEGLSITINHALGLCVDLFLTLDYLSDNYLDFLLPLYHATRLYMLEMPLYFDPLVSSKNFLTSLYILTTIENQNHLYHIEYLIHPVLFIFPPLKKFILILLQIL